MRSEQFVSTGSLQGFTNTRATRRVAVLLGLLGSGAAFGQIGAAPTDRLITKGTLDWKSGPVAISAQGPALAAQTAQQLVAASDRHFMIQLTESLTPAARADFLAAGIELQSYLGDNAFYAFAPGNLDAARLAAVATLRAAQPIRIDWKLAPEYRNARVWDYAVARPEEALSEALPEDAEAPEPADQLQSQLAPVDVRPTDWVAANVLIHADTTFTAAVQLVDANGGLVRSKFVEPNGLTIEIPYSGLLGLIAEDAIAWAEPPLPGFSELNAQNRATTRVDIVQAPPYSLTGAGVTAMIYDGGTVRTTHQDFNGRAVNGDTAGVSSHATHVSGTVGGSGTFTAANRGMAPGVNLVCYTFEVPGGLSQGFLYTQPGDLQQDYGNAITVRGADISNNSIGTNTAQNGYPCDWTGNYNITDQVIDGIVRGSVSNGAPYRIVWANGNERGSGRCVPLEGWNGDFHSTAPPACAKNHITVGATLENAAGPATFTSYGPADDGRLKPDICAPGVNVLSTSSSGDTTYTTFSGTSMSSPTTCGVGALILSDFRVQFAGEPDFRNSTLKTFLAHSARDQIGTGDNRGPDYRFGYGLIDAQASIDLMRSGNWFEASLQQGETRQFFVLVPSGASEVRVTLAWDDPAAAVLPASALVNDLDLRVFSTGGTQFFPWTLPTTNTPAMGSPAVRTQADHVNNIEQVVIDAPTPGVYRVEILGFNVPQGPQPYSVTATPVLINCSSTGVISLSSAQYACNDSLTAQVVDCDLNTDDNTTQTVNINIASSSVPAGIPVLLTESDPASSTFVGTIALGAIGDLAVLHNDAITATYNDADTGSGSPGVATATATVDCVAPQITDVTVLGSNPGSIQVAVTLSEAATATVNYGLTCAATTSQIDDNTRSTTHTFVLTSLNPTAPEYFLRFEARDAVGNTAQDDNGGQCYRVVKPTALFYDEFPLTTLDAGNWAINETVVVDGTGNNEPSAPNSARFNGHPDGTDSLTSTPINLGSFSLVRLSYWFQRGGANAPEVGDDLVVELLNSSSQWVEVRRHVGGAAMTAYEQANVSLTGGFLHAGLQLRFRSSGTASATAFNDEWFVDDVQMFVPTAPEAFAVNATAVINTGVTIQLNAADPNNDPLTYVILSLPSIGSLLDPNAGAVSVVPYTLAAGGSVVRYIPSSGFTGNDGFTYRATDGANLSNQAAVSVTVEPGIVTELFFDPFPSTTFNNSIWSQVTNATIDTVGTAEPTEPNSARLNGTPTANGDSFASAPVDTTGHAEVRFAYLFERRGGGESPDLNDDLIVEYMNAASQWIELDRQLGSGPDMTTYEPRVFIMPAAAIHSGARFRFRCNAAASSDDWFVDNVRLYAIDPPPVVSIGDMNCDGVVSVADIGGFVLALTDPIGYAAQFPACDIENADLNDDGQVTVADIGPFVALLTGS